MRFTKVLGLAAVAAVAAMAFIGTSSALATDSIVLCKELITDLSLCKAGELAPSGTVLLALATNPKLTGGFSEIKCPDSTVTAETTAASGATLPITITSLEFGSLPTPSLGNGCTTCTGGVHTTPPYTGEIEVETIEDKDKTKLHDWFFKTSGSAELLNCFGLGITCAYGSSSILSLIDNDAGEHPSAAEKPAGSGKHPTYGIILISTSLTKTGGSGLCPGSGTWTADYYIYALDKSKTDSTKLDAWLALDS